MHAKIIQMRIIGIDYGSKKIGIALSSGGHIMPLETVENRENHIIKNFAVKKIAEIINSENPDKIVIGNPDHKSGIVKSELSTFVDSVKDSVDHKYEFIFVDEFKTTDLSTKVMIDLGVSRKKRKDDDSYSACVIIANYLAEQSV